MTEAQLDPTLPLDDQATAVHELGHAFVARATGLIPGALKINRWLGGGWCEIRSAADATIEQANTAALPALAAGRVAEEIWRDGADLGRPWSWGTSGDHEIMRSIIDYQGGSISAAEAEAREHLLTVWDELVELISPLARDGRLAGIE